MKPNDFADNTYVDSIEEINDKDPKFKVGDLLRKFPKYTQIDRKRFLWSKMLKILFAGHMLLMISMAKKLLEHFMKKNYRKQINKDFG